MTGLLGGGHAIYSTPRRGTARNLDCFCAVPGLGADPREPELVHLDVPFGAEVVHYAVGAGIVRGPGRAGRARRAVARARPAALAQARRARAPPRPRRRRDARGARRVPRRCSSR